MDVSEAGEAATVVRWANRALARINAVMTTLGMCALVAASLVLTHSVITRYVLGYATDWQDTIAVFCLVGAVFLSSAHVQSIGGHIAIEALAEILPPRINRIRRVMVLWCSFAFCAFFAWKSWTLTYEAWTEGYRLASSFSPPLSIPYFMMSVGMTLLTVQIFLQAIARRPPPPALEAPTRPVGNV
ncbi:MAG TPA: TRAP transporter small permease [Alphaproteobacteria bacterium]|nr:TRAP transporter small permease [Alphaproteobacteria bacterium]